MFHWSLVFGVWCFGRVHQLLGRNVDNVCLGSRTCFLNASNPAEKKAIISDRTFPVSAGSHIPSVSTSSLRGLQRINAKAPQTNSSLQYNSAGATSGNLA